jgi:hypothetical protein
LNLKTKTHVLEVNTKLQLNATEIAAYNGIKEGLQIRITQEIKQKT